MNTTEAQVSIEVATQSEQTFHLSGALTLFTAPSVREQLKQGLHSDTALATVDMSAVSELDSSGISVLAELNKNLMSRKGKMILAHTPDHIFAVLEHTGLDRVFRFAA